jgi:hypothetical protein
MAIGRSLTKKLQKLNQTVRSRAESLTPGTSTTPVDEKPDLFYSIKFEQTVVPYDESSDTCSISSSRVVSIHSTSTLAPITTSPTSATSGASDEPRTRRNTLTSCSATPSSLTPSSTSPGLSISTSTTPGISTPSSPSLTSAFSRDLLPLLNKSQQQRDKTLLVGGHKSNGSESSSCYSEPTESFDEDAQADEMALHILEKVNADEYIKELRTGSWCI